MHKRICYLFFFLVFCLPVSAQEIEIPDPDLREAIKETLNIPLSEPITRTDIQSLRQLVAKSRDIEVLTGLEAATQLEYLVLSGNRIKDIEPLANLIKLEHLALGENRISNIDALANLTNLTELHLSSNHIIDVSPLSGLTQLKRLYLSVNRIVNVRPLSGLTSLRDLEIVANNIVDHTPLDNLSLVHYVYDQTCDSPPLPLEPRLQNRTYPSVFAAFSTTFNQPHLSFIERMAQHDLHFSRIIFGVKFFDTGDGWEIRSATKRDPFELRDAFLSFNPNMLFLTVLPLRAAWLHEHPATWPYWLRDAQGNIVHAGAVDEGRHDGFIDFTHPGFQDLTVEHAIAIANCGLYDGIIFDWWSDDGPLLVTYDPYTEYRGHEVEMQAKINILQRIRAHTRPDFLIMGNTNDHIIPRTGQYLNGGIMEGIVPTTNESLVRVRKALDWLEQNLRRPRLNLLEGGSNPDEPPDSPANLRLMRAFTTLSLTHSDGYVVFSLGSTTRHYWHDFWDADLGRPVGERAQLYQETEGLYIREFTNGWAVYNHSGGAQVITLPEEAQGVASGLSNTEHALPNLDGEMYLRVTPPNPADVNGDGVVNILDLTLVAQAFGKDGLQGDVNEDGVVNVFDLVFVANAF